MDPLVVAGGGGELIDLCLGDQVPVTHAGFFSDVLPELIDIGNNDNAVCCGRGCRQPVGSFGALFECHSRQLLLSSPMLDARQITSQSRKRSVCSSFSTPP